MEHLPTSSFKTEQHKDYMLTYLTSGLNTVDELDAYYATYDTPGWQHSGVTARLREIREEVRQALLEKEHDEIVRGLPYSE